MKSYNLRIAITIVIANMIGAGIFTTLGLQLAEVKNPWVVMTTWVIGGVIALTGALSYSRMARIFPRSGGEYHFLGKLYGRNVGLSAGIVSLFVGFAAPLALTSMALGQYLQHILPFPPEAIAITIIILFTSIHLVSAKFGGEVHFGLTTFKVILILAFIIIGLNFQTDKHAFTENYPPFAESILQPGFAVALLFAGFAYTGWNAAIYVIDEIKHAHRNVGLSLIIATILVTIIYLLLNYTFLSTSSISALTGKIEVGQLSSEVILGKKGQWITISMISLALISSISGLIIGGSRVFKIMAEDYDNIKKLSYENKYGVPVPALLIQSGIAITLLLLFPFVDILTYVEFTLTIFAIAVVAGNFKLSKKHPLSGIYLWATIIFLILDILIVVYVTVEKTSIALSSFLLILLILISTKLITERMA